MKKRILLFLQIVLFALAANAQTSPNVKVTVKGQVVDSLTNETIPYATLKIVDKDNPVSVIKAVPTDDNGNFKLEMNTSGEYRMIIQFIGKNDMTLPLIIGKEKNIDFGKLRMTDNSQALNEVVISAQRPLVVVDMDKITYNLQEDPESKTNNLLEMFKKIPMITVDGEDNIKLKGSSSFKIYLNGKPSNMISNNPKDVLKSMPANTIKDVEVITDPGAKYDAEGVAGIINIITHKQSSLGGYTATLNAGANSRGGFNGGVYASMKYGKVGFTGNYNYYDHKNPRSSYFSERENLNNNTDRFLLQNGTMRNSGSGQYGSGELSFELDTLNLINVGFNRYGGDYKSNDNIVSKLLDSDNAYRYEYERAGYAKGTYGGTDINVDYQRTFNKKDQLLTISYRLGLSPDNTESNSDIKLLQGVLPPHIRSNEQFTDAKTSENTFQSDFVTPFGKIHTLEAGVKYIIRSNNSNSGLLNQDAGGSWAQTVRFTDEFKHRNDIMAAYGGYSAKINKWGFKTGLRFESTRLDVRYPLHEAMNIDPSPEFKVNYSNWVPSVTATYQLRPSQTIRLGYNMRIYRPGIWQLNPYEDTTDPNNTRKGNPELDAVKSHSINTNYMFFNPKLNINVNVSYNFENNAISELTSVKGDVRHTTFENISKNKFLNMSFYVNYSPIAKLRLSTNMWGGYADLKTNNGSGLANSGYNIGMHGDIQYTLPWSLRSGFNFGYFGSGVQLQGDGSAFSFYGFSLMKSFLSDRLTINAYIQNPFNNEHKFKMTQEDASFRFRTESSQFRRQGGLRVSFRFGELKAQIKKAQRGINNDDSMGGGSKGGNQGGGGKGN